MSPPANVFDTDKTAPDLQWHEHHPHEATDPDGVPAEDEAAPAKTGTGSESATEAASEAAEPGEATDPDLKVDLDRTLEGEPGANPEGEVDPAARAEPTGEPAVEKKETDASEPADS